MSSTISTAKKFDLKATTWFVFVLIAIFSLGNQIIYRYLIPAGQDPFNHDRYVQLILDGKLGDAANYHILWHTIVAFFTLITGLNSLTVMAWLGPTLLIFTALSVYIFTRRFFGPVAGLASAVAIGFFSRQPIQTLYDGGFPDVLTTGVIIPILFMTVLNLTETPRSGKVWRLLVGLVGLSG